MYLCQQLTGNLQIERDKYFNMKNIGSVSYTTQMLRVKKRENKNSQEPRRSLILLVKQKPYVQVLRATLGALRFEHVVV